MARLRMGGGMRWVVALIMVIGSVIAYFSNSEFNPITEEEQRVSMTADQEIALGLQAAPEMTEQYEGLHPNREAQQQVERVGQRLADATAADDTLYKFDFHLLADPQNPASASSAAVAAMVGRLANMKYGRDDELQSDNLGVRFLLEAGYDPSAMIRVMEILRDASGGGSRQPEFFSTHPDPGNRIERIQEAIQKYSVQKP